MAVPLRTDFYAATLRRLARGCSDNRQIRRLLALAAVCDGMSRTQSVKIGGMDRQTLRDWVHRFIAQGPDGLINRAGAGRPRLLSDEIIADAMTLVSGSILIRSNASPTRRLLEWQERSGKRRSARENCAN